MVRQMDWRVLARCAAIFTAALLAFPMFAMAGTDPQGDWLTANGQGVVQIMPCGDTLCGRIVGIERGPNDPMPTDVGGHPQCGLTIISGEKPQSSGSWLGTVTDPRDGNSYRARLSVGPRGDLRMRVYIGIPALGATQVWRKFTGHLSDACRFT